VESINAVARSNCLRMLSLEESGAQGDNRLEAIIIYVEQRRDHGSLLLLG
jgi:hypothetical protein